MSQPLLWASPLPPRRTDIANATDRLRRALNGQADAPEMVAFDCDEMARLGRWMEESPQAGLPVFNLGNDVRFHGDIFLSARDWPGMVLAHDSDLSISLGQLFERLGHVPESFHAMADGPLEALRWLSANALGVITHNPAEQDKLASMLGLPVFALPLIWQTRSQHGQLFQRGIHAEPSPGAPFRLVMFGFMGTNRGLDLVLEMMRHFDGKRGLELDIYGPLAPGSGLDRVIAEAGLGGRMRYHGYVSEPELDEALRRADLAINLRRPSMGEASGSQLRIWDAGVPSVVCDTGWWASLPAGLAFRLPDRDGLGADLAALIRHLMDYPAHGRAVARAGRAWLEANHGVQHWCSAMAEIQAAIPDLWQGWRGRRDLTRPSLGGQLPRLARLQRAMPLDGAALKRPCTAREAIVFVTDEAYAGAVGFVANRLCRDAAKAGVEIVALVTDERALVSLRRHAPEIRLIPASPGNATTGSAQHVSPASWAKLHAAKLLGPAYRRLLYLDPDIVLVRRDLTRLFQLDMQGAPLAAIRDLAAHYDPTTPPSHRPGHLGLGEDLRYFNAGVMLIDPARFEEEHIAEKALHFVNTAPERCLYGEQCALNAAMAGQWLELSPRWNWIWRYGGGDERFCNWLASTLPISCLHLAGTLKPWNDAHAELAHRWRAPWHGFVRHNPWAGEMQPLHRRPLDFTPRPETPPLPLPRRHSHPGAVAAMPESYDQTVFADVAQGLCPAFPVLSGIGQA